MDVLSEPPSVHLYQIFLALLLVFINGFFVATEIALVKTRASKLETLPANSKIQTLIVNKAIYFTENINQFLAATQIGITLASLALGWVGETVFNQLFQQLFFYLQLDLPTTLVNSLSIGMAFALITALHIILGEMIPKIVAINLPLRVTLLVTLPMWLFYWVVRPIVCIFEYMVKAILTLLRIENTTTNGALYSEEELKLIISDSQEAGTIGETERKLIENVFIFDECEVVDLLTNRKNIKALDVKTGLKAALHEVIQSGHSRYVIYEDNLDNVVGVINVKDLIKKWLLTKDENASIAELVRQPLFIHENAKISSLLRKMQQQRMQLAITTNEVGEITGIITFEDIVVQLVGVVKDEHGKELTIVSKLSENSFEILAHNSLVKINNYLPIKLPESEMYDTLSGLIQHSYPDVDFNVGASIELENYTGTVTKMNRNTVEIIQLQLKSHLTPQQDFVSEANNLSTNGIR